MKKYLLFFVILIFTLSLYSVSTTVSFNIKSYYDSNIINLSDDSRDNFIDSYNSEKYRIGSLDDWITSFNVGLAFKHRYFFNHTQKIKLRFTSDNYYYNSVKSNVKMAFSIKQYLSKRVNFGMAYSYYPKIYLRRYKSEFDTSNEYHDFTYAKNIYSIFSNVLPIKYLEFKFGINYSQLYYNEYFTEYDTNDTEFFGLLKTHCKDFITLQLSYGYKTSRQINSDNDDAIKDPSADYNIYRVMLIIGVTDKLKDEFSVKYEEKYFNTKNPDDLYHCNRKDYKTIIKNSLTYKLSDKYLLKLFGEYERRNTISNVQTVVDDKSYHTFKMGLNIGIKLKY